MLTRMEGYKIFDSYMVLVFTSLFRLGACEDNDTASYLIKQVLKRSDVRIRPNIDGDPVNVNCGFYVVSFGPVSEIDMDYSMDIYMRKLWIDDRLAFSSDRVKSLTLSGKSLEQIWTPDLFFPNEKSADFHSVTVPNKVAKVYANGTIVYSLRITLTLSCPMDLTHFPMDRQNCAIKIESYSYNTDEIRLHWFQTEPIEIDMDLELPQFHLDGYNILECTRTYKTGEYPCLKANFRLERQYGYYLLQTYLPSILIVILSWVSFWINMDAVPARISLGVTTVLTLVTQMSAAKTTIVSYPKAIDVWLSTCMFFVFAALLEYAIINSLSRKHKKLARRDESIKTTKSETMQEELVAPKFSREWLRSTDTARLIDKLSRILFPLAFLIFNIIYWIVYLNPQLTD